tara:strand:- start:198 stop:494 length:297 start_codon:yes stop_codon:yes gene_type:complete
MVFLSIFAERFHQSLRDWKEGEKLCVVVFCILLLLLLDRSGRLSRASSRNEDVFPNENLELIIIIEVEEEEGTTLREEHRRRRRLLEKEEELVAEVVA